VQDLPADSYAAGNNFGSLNRSRRTIMAHAMRAILLASATAATLIGRSPIRRASQSRFKCRLPCFEVLRGLSLPPVECCLGTKLIHALRPDENIFQSPTSATSAVATIGPTPGISSSRRLSSLERAKRGYASRWPRSLT